MAGRVPSRVRIPQKMPQVIAGGDEDVKSRFLPPAVERFIAQPLERSAARCWAGTTMSMPGTAAKSHRDGRRNNRLRTVGRRSSTARYRFRAKAEPFNSTFSALLDGRRDELERRRLEIYYPEQ
jgi:hypothetical protein